MSLLTVYKPAQGKIVRLSTAGTLAVVAILITFWLIQQPGISGLSPLWKLAVGGMLMLVVGFGIFRLMNWVRFADFMIMTESEMRKVYWPPRPTVIAWTKVVISLTLILALLLTVVDSGFVQVAKWLKLI